LSKEKLLCPNMTLSMFIKGKFDFRHVQVWLWICLSKEELTLDMIKYDFMYVYQRKNWIWIYPNMTLSMFIKGKVDFGHVQIWLVKGRVDFRHIQI
jgi:hypothetical protein